MRSFWRLTADISFANSTTNQRQCSWQAEVPLMTPQSWETLSFLLPMCFQVFSHLWLASQHLYQFRKRIRFLHKKLKQLARHPTKLQIRTNCWNKSLTNSRQVTLKSEWTTTEKWYINIEVVPPKVMHTLTSAFVQTEVKSIFLNPATQLLRAVWGHWTLSSLVQCCKEMLASGKLVGRMKPAWISSTY